MIPRNVARLALVALIVLAASSVVFAIAANIAVPSTRLMDQSSIITANLLKPASCSAVTLAAVIYCPAGGGVCTGTDASELVLGSAASDDIQSGKGDDCILSGGGDDTLRGEQGRDICMGGPGVDTFHASCETQSQ